MKKVIIGLSGLIVLTFIIIFTVNSQNSDQKSRNADSIESQDISTYPPMGKCCNNSDLIIASCNTTNCSIMKCDPSTCKGDKCDPATCKPNCGGVSIEMKCVPMNCNR
jgi:hypothetical protein